MADGTSIVEDRSDSVVAKVSGVLCEPDRGEVVGFFVQSLTEPHAAVLFLSVQDIVAWGAYIHILDRDRLAEPSDLVRLRSLLTNGRRIIGQQIITRKRRTKIGVCRDIQFDTHHFRIEWIFPYKFFFFAQSPIAVKEIIEVKREYIIVKEPLRPLMVKSKEEKIDVGTLQDVLPATSMETKI